MADGVLDGGDSDRVLVQLRAEAVVQHRSRVEPAYGGQPGEQLREDPKEGDLSFPVAGRIGSRSAKGKRGGVVNAYEQYRAVG